MKSDINLLSLISHSLKKVSQLQKDQILYISRQGYNEKEAIDKLEITNEDQKIRSYTELERDKNSLETFKSVLQQSIAGTLKQTVSKINSKGKQVDPAQAMMQILALIAALVAIFYGLKALPI